jgi:hypothetical protein
MKLAQKLSFSLNYRQSRTIFSWFRKSRREGGEHTPIIVDMKQQSSKTARQSTPQEPSNPESQGLTSYEQELVAKRDQYFIEMVAEREKYELERNERKKNVEYASLRSRREFEVTMANLDYSKVLIQNISYIPESEFENFDQ